MLNWIETPPKFFEIIKLKPGNYILLLHYIPYIFKEEQIDFSNQLTFLIQQPS